MRRPNNKELLNCLTSVNNLSDIDQVPMTYELEMDSMQWMQFALTLEETFECEVSLNDPSVAKTVEQILECVEFHLE